MRDPDQLIAGLRAWTKNHDPNVRAAVELLIEQGHWLTDDAFIAACIHVDPHDTWIGWEDARHYLQSGPPSSAGEVAMLRLAVDLGSDRYQFCRLGSRNIQLAVRAFSQAADR